MQFLYGEDGMDAIRVEKQEFDTYKLEESKFRAKYFMDISSKTFGQINENYTGHDAIYYLDTEIIEKCKGDAELRLMLEEEYDQLCSDRAKLRDILGYRGSETDESIQIPVNIDRLIWNAQRNFRVNTHEPTVLHPRTVLESVRKLYTEDIILVRGEDMLSREAQQNATLLFQIMLRLKFCILYKQFYTRSKIRIT
jgi:DNA-directed RNA polymerase II subunit RPB1